MPDLYTEFKENNTNLTFLELPANRQQTKQQDPTLMQMGKPLNKQNLCSIAS